MTELEPRLNLLVEAGVKARLAMPPSFKDDASALPEVKRVGWAQFISSIATTESIEEMLMTPIRAGFMNSGSTASVLRYLDAHGDDERRHHALLTQYVRETFGYEKTRKTGSDIVVYGVLLPCFSRMGRYNAVYLLAALRFYEAFSLEFYETLKTLAKRDGLGSLVALIQAVEKDELRHLAGLEALVLEHRKNHGAPNLLDLSAIRSLLRVLLIDIDIRPWALHNRRARRNAVAIGIDPLKMGRDASNAARDAVRFVAGRSPGQSK